MSENKKKQVKKLTITDWDAPMPTGAWKGVESIPLFPLKIDPEGGDAEKVATFRQLHIQYYVTKDQHEKLSAWVKENIPEDMHWLFHSLDIFHQQMQNMFYALPGVHINRDEEDSRLLQEHPEVLDENWDNRLDVQRLKFMQFILEIGGKLDFVSEEEALDNGQLLMPDYPRPNIIGSQDTYPGLETPPKRLWRYMSLTKFAAFLQTKSIWFSRPQYFDDPHEFSMDLSSQRELIEWKLNSFMLSYNRAKRAGLTKYLNQVEALVEGLPLDNDGFIKPDKIKFSELSPLLVSSIKSDIRKWQESFFISCWRYSPHDNVAMWNQYASMDEGIAIVADVEKMRKALCKSGDIRMAIVDYKDLSDGALEPMRLNPLSYKDIRFSTEQEARFYFRASADNEKGIAISLGEDDEINDVIKEVHISPHASEWFAGIIKDMLQKYGLKAEVNVSPLNNIPNKF